MHYLFIKDMKQRIWKKFFKFCFISFHHFTEIIIFFKIKINHMFKNEEKFVIHIFWPFCGLHNLCLAHRLLTSLRAHRPPHQWPSFQVWPVWPDKIFCSSWIWSLCPRFEEISASGSQCRSKDKAKGKCYGGVARLKATVDAIKAKEPNVILLNGGDFFQVKKNPEGSVNLKPSAKTSAFFLFFAKLGSPYAYLHSFINPTLFAFYVFGGQRWIICLMKVSNWLTPECYLSFSKVSHEFFQSKLPKKGKWFKKEFSQWW